VEAHFAGTSGYRWVAYVDPDTARHWAISGPRLVIETEDGRQVDLAVPGAQRILNEAQQVILESTLTDPNLETRQTFTFAPDGRTLRIQTRVRAPADPVRTRRVLLLALDIAGQNLRLMGPGSVSAPVFGDAIFAGIEHPSAQCQVTGSTLVLSQPLRRTLDQNWSELPSAVFGSAPPNPEAPAEALRRAFLRYLDTVRVKPTNLHIHYNDWWTAPVPSSESFVLANLDALKRGLHEPTGFFFDSYALDAGWSDPQSLWEIDRRHFPQRFAPIADALARLGSRPGLWISPSSLYPFALDNRWLATNNFETAPHPTLGAVPCLARGTRYQVAFKQAALRYAREAGLAHMKFDGCVPRCDASDHGHPPGADSQLPIAEGLIEVFDALRAQNPGIALEPTCFGPQPSPWWLLHTPFILGPFGDDSPYGRCPAPDYIESMTTARDLANREGRDAFLVPSSALECFDIVLQCPGSFQNHAVMAIGRGRWFFSSYINPRFMDPTAWRFFADALRWARVQREFLQEPLPFGGDPANKQPYGYAFLGSNRHLLCLRNPWIEPAQLPLPARLPTPRNAELRMLYPRPGLITRIEPAAPTPALALGPYETQLIEIVPTDRLPFALTNAPTPPVAWSTTQDPQIETVLFPPDPPALGPSWTSPDGTADRQTRLVVDGRLALTNLLDPQLCVLCTGNPAVAENSCRVQLDDHVAPLQISQTQGAFGAAGAGLKEHWIWFLAALPAGEHRLRIELTGPALDTPTAVFLRADLANPASAQAIPAPAASDTPAFPAYRPDRIPWSRVLVPLASRSPAATPPRTVPRRIDRIDGIFLDTVDWTAATAGWGQPQRNRTVMEKPLMLGATRFPRGLGTHAPSRITYALPPGFATFAATLGKDQEVPGGSVVFAIELDGKEVFRSPVFRNDTPPREIAIAVAGARHLALIVEDAGDTLNADHADWALARLLR
jgi:hypothetical protein